MESNNMGGGAHLLHESSCTLERKCTMQSFANLYSPCKASPSHHLKTLLGASRTNWGKGRMVAIKYGVGEEEPVNIFTRQHHHWITILFHDTFCGLNVFNWPNALETQFSLVVLLWSHGVVGQEYEKANVGWTHSQGALINICFLSKLTHRLENAAS